MVEIYDLPSETADGTITLKWKEPDNNGKEIIQYTVYQRIVNDGERGEWKIIKKVMDVSVTELKVKLEKGKVYEFAITATNELGESLKKEETRKIKRVKPTGSMLSLKWASNVNCQYFHPSTAFHFIFSQ